MDKKNKKSLLKMRSFQDGIFVGLCSAGLLGYSLYHHHFDRNTSEWKLSPFLFPVLISVFGLLLTISLIADARREQKAAEDTGEKPAKEKHNLPGALILIGASIVYYFILPVLHFIPATILYLAGLFVYLGERKWWKVILLSVITTAAIFLLFGKGLNVRLP